MTAFQNPATIQGNVMVNSTISTRSIALNPEGDNAKAYAINPAIETANSAANNTRRPAWNFGASTCLIDVRGAQQSAMTSSGNIELDDITQQMFE